MTFRNLSPVPFQRVRVNSAFWSPRIQSVRVVTAKVCLDKCEETGRIGNFRRAAGLEQGPFRGIFFDDSDVYKVLEGVAYVLMDGADPELKRRADEVIDAICAAQQPDGYLNSYFTLTGLDKRWSDMSYHEDYCLGHMIEGAVAYDRATGEDKWLKAAIRFVEHMMSVIGEGKRHWVTGHQEIELALIKLYRHTGDKRFFDYAKWLIEERGHGHLEAEGFRRYGMDESYCQDDRPARELEKVTGHAVRAMYYYSAMADVAALEGDEGMYRALVRLWDNVCPANLYITGGIGQDGHHEGFTRDWSLPNLTAYCETCAQIGMTLWNDRMNLIAGEAKYADIVELELYTGALSGLSISGDRFFYDNPLSSVGKYRRSEWFGCSCCPTNLIRFVPSVGGYAYAAGEGEVYVNQFIAGNAAFDTPGGSFAIAVETDYPWSGAVKLRVNKAEGVDRLLIRKPGWCERYGVRINGEPVELALRDGYLVAQVVEGDTVEFGMDMPIRFLRADARVEEDLNRVAVARGPIVYCAEEIDNPGSVREYFHAVKAIDPSAPVSTEAEEIAGTNVIAVRVGDVKLIPYFAWNNRGQGAMAVWLMERGKS